MRTNTLTKVLVGIVAVIIVLLLVAEFGLRWFIGNQLSNEVQNAETGESANISFGAQPLLLGIAKQNLSNVEITTPDSLVITYGGQSGDIPEITGTPESVVTLKDLSLKDPNNPIAGHMTMKTLASDEFLLATIQREMALNMQQQPQQSGGNPFEGGEFNLESLASGFLQNIVKITDISSNGATGTVDVQITNGVAALTLRPEVTNGTMGFTAENASLFGFELPESVSQKLTEALSKGMGDTGGDASITSVNVVDGGVSLTMEGDNVNLNDIQAPGATTTGTSGTAQTQAS